MMPSSCDTDPFAALEQEAARQAAAEKATKAIAAARVRLILGRDARSAFFATLALRLRTEVSWDAPTMQTDGKRLEFNPSFVNQMKTPDELVGVIAHEVMHLALGHHARQGDRDPSRWNEAADLAINPLLISAGFILPPDRLMPGEGKYAELQPGLSAEAYYGMLPAPPEGEQGVDGDGGRGDDPGGCGSVKKPGSPAECSDSAAEWAAAVVQAETAAKGRGELPAGIARTVSNVIHPPADWKAVLREFVAATAKNDYSWSRPNRRHVHRGLYLPGLHSDELGEVVLAIDTSGSIDEKVMATFASEVESILSVYECRATILYCDSEIQKVQEWEPADGPLKLEAIGGGGTDHNPVFEWLAASGKVPACIVCLTDMDSSFPAQAPDVPVLWAVVGGSTSTAPFGKVVNLSQT